jgi:hypothetical protein
MNGISTKHYYCRYGVSHRYIGNRPISIGVETEQSDYAAGSTLRGKVYLCVNNRQSTPVAAQSLQLRLIGKESALIHHQSSDTDSRDNPRTDNHYERRKNTFFQLEYPLYTYLNHFATVGRYEYPFSISLPQHLPSSLSASSGQSHCEVEYELVATLIQQGGSNKSLFRSGPHGYKKISISASVEAPNDTSVQHPEDIIPVNCCCCSKRESMTLETSLDKTVVTPYDIIGVQFRCKNNSFSKVHTITVQMEQIIEWKCDVHKKEVKQILSKTEFSGKSYPELIASIPKSTFCCFSGGYEHIQDDTMDQEWHSAQLQVPGNSQDSYQGQAINVRHVVSVILASEGCWNSNPESATLVQLVQSFSGPTGSKLDGQAVPTSKADLLDGQPGFVSPSYAQAPQPSAPFATIDGAPALAQAHVLPPDWNAQTAEVVETPIAQAIVIEPSAPFE